MERICQLKERDYRDKDEFDYAPQDYADAMDSYDKILEITGEITGETIAPNAEGVDEEGPHCGNGRVEYASGTKQKPGCDGQSRTERHDHAPSFRWLELPHHPPTPCARKLLPPPMQVSETSGLCKTVLKRCMNSVTKTSTAVSFPYLCR